MKRRNVYLIITAFFLMLERIAVIDGVIIFLTRLGIPITNLITLFMIIEKIINFITPFVLLWLVSYVFTLKEKIISLVKYSDLLREDVDEVENFKQDYLEEAILDILEDMGKNNLLISKPKNIKSDFIKEKLNQHIGKYNEKRLSELEKIKSQITGKYAKFQ